MWVDRCGWIGVGGEVWVDRCGCGGVGGEVWVDRCGCGGVGGNNNLIFEMLTKHRLTISRLGGK